MKIIQKIITILLGFAIMLAGNLYIANKIFAPKYIINAASKADINSGLAEFIPKKLNEVAMQNPSSENAEFSKAVNSLLTDQYIKQKSQKVLSDFDQLFSGQREKVTIDFQDLANEAQAKGVYLDLSQMKPVEVSADQIKVQKEVSKQADILQIASIVLTLLLFLASLTLGFVTKNLKTLYITLLTSAVLFSITGLSIFIIANVLPSKLQFTGSMQTLAPYLTKIIKIAGNNATIYYAVFALVLLVTFIILLIIQKTVFQNPKIHQENQAPIKEEDKLEVEHKQDNEDKQV